MSQISHGSKEFSQANVVAVDVGRLSTGPSMRLHPSALSGMPDRADPLAAFTRPTLEQIQQAREAGEADARAWNGSLTPVARVQDSRIVGVGVRVYDPETKPSVMPRPVVV